MSGLFLVSQFMLSSACKMIVTAQGALKPAKAFRILASLDKAVPGLGKTLHPWGPPSWTADSSAAAVPVAGLPPVPRRSLRSYLTPPENCCTWARRAGACSWCSCRGSAPWTTGPSARMRYCDGELPGASGVGHGLLPLVPSKGYLPFLSWEVEGALK